jgi:hypothetical protein
MTPQEEQDYLDDRFTEACDDCTQGPDAHTVWTNNSGTTVVDCNDD